MLNQLPSEVKKILVRVQKWSRHGESGRYFAFAPSCPLGSWITFPGFL
jgi:hypothetical protein